MRHPRGYWTLERLQADALQYQTRSAWGKGSSGAYQTAKKQGLLEECCGHMEVLQTPWTLERLQADALQYQTRSAWYKVSPNGYAAARRQGLLEECCGHMEVLQTSWTLERLQADALQYQTRSAWDKGSKSAYGAAYKQGLLEECCGHMKRLINPNGHWTLERLQEDALQYQTRTAWSKGSPGSYNTAKKQGLLEECCGHMDDGWIGSDNDTVYFWKAEGTEFYKIGVTSERLGMQRINDVANASGFTPVLLAMTAVNGKATAIETELLRKFNRSAGLEGFDGCTEFRHLASWEAVEIMETLANASS